jgi:alpha-tubulin suppressor-like RCC1 family protein
MSAWLLALASLTACGRLDFDATSAGGPVVFDPAPRLAIGDDHACLRVGTSVACWGENDGGQLGDGTVVYRNVMTPVPGFGAIDLGLGQNHSCAIDPDHRLWCWGANPDGELGCAPDCDINVPPMIATPKQLPDTRTYGRIYADDFHTCAIADRDASVWCWGKNHVGELGVGDLVPRAAPTRIRAAGVDRYKRLALGNNHTCGEQADGTVWCWGLASALGIGSSAGMIMQPILVTAIASITEFDAGRDYTCAIANDAIECWGSNMFRALGIADPTTQLTPIANGRTGATKLAAGATHACAFTSAGLECWGDNSQGGLGVGTVTASEVVAPAIPGTWVEIAAGDRFTCAIDASSQVWCWGHGASGQTGNGNAVSVSVPTLAH